MAGARCLGVRQARFGAAFTALFALSVLCRVIGHYAYIAATSYKPCITWPLNLSGESDYIIALLFGLAIATGAAIRARPIVAVMVSSLVVIFAEIGLLLPFLAKHFLYEEPMVAGAWKGLAVKTDGAAIPAVVKPPLASG